MQTEDEQLILKKAQKAEYDKLYYKKNKEKISNYYYNNKEKIYEYQQNNKEKIAEYRKQWLKDNKEKIAEYNKNNKDKILGYYENNKEKIKEYNKVNKEKFSEFRKIWYQNNKNKQAEYQKEYRKNNKKRQAEHTRNRKKIDPLFKLRCNLSTRTNSAFKNKEFIKSQSTLKMLGCDLQTAKAHLQKQFTKGMTWDNYGEWHIDHIIPCASAKTEEELIKLFHYTNFQPLWAIDNFSKGDKIIEKQLFLL